LEYSNWGGMAAGTPAIEEDVFSWRVFL